MTIVEVSIEKPHNPRCRIFHVAPFPIDEIDGRSEFSEFISYSGMYSKYGWENRLEQLHPSIRVIAKTLFEALPARLRQIYISPGTITCHFGQEDEIWSEDEENIVKQILETFAI